MSLLRELKRRKVFRVAMAYAVVGWLLGLSNRSADHSQAAGATDATDG